MLLAIERAPSKRDPSPTLGERKRRLEAAIEWKERVATLARTEEERHRLLAEVFDLDAERQEVILMLDARKWKVRLAIILTLGAIMVGIASYLSWVADLR